MKICCDWSDCKIFFNMWILDQNDRPEFWGLNALSNLYLFPVRYLFQGETFEVDAKLAENLKIKKIAPFNPSKPKKTASLCSRLTKKATATAALGPGILFGGLLKGFYYYASDTALKNHHLIKQQQAKEIKDAALLKRKEYVASLES